MKIALMQTGKTSEKHIADGVEIYASRLKRYCGFEIITLPDIKNTRNMSAREQMAKEGGRIVEVLGKDDYVVLLDERGKEFRTVEFAEWIEKRSMIPGKRVVFIIGGPWGFSDEVYSVADFQISLSR